MSDKVPAIYDKMKKIVVGDATFNADATTIRVLIATRNNITSKYTDFLKQLRKTAENPQLKGTIGLTLDISKELVSLIDTFTGSKKKVITQQHIDRFYFITNEFERHMHQIYTQYEADMNLKRKMHKLDSNTTDKFERLDAATKLFKSRVMSKKDHKGGVKGTVTRLKDVYGSISPLLDGFAEGSEHLGGAYGEVKDFGLSMLAGPFAPLLTALGTGASGAYKHYKSSKEQKERAGLDLGLAGEELELTPADIDKMKHLHDTGKGSIGDVLGGGHRQDLTMESIQDRKHNINDNLSVPTQMTSTAQTDTSARRKTTSAGAGMKTTTASTEVSLDGLQQFYTTAAFTTPYTKTVLQLLQTIAKSEGKSSSKDKTSLGSKVSTAAKGLVAKALPYAPMAAGLAAAGMGIWDTVKGVGKADDWFGKGERKATLGEKVSSGIGGLLGGTDKGLGQKGSTWGGVLKQSLWGAGKGALAGFAMGGPLGALIGAGTGVATHLVGGERIAKGTAAAGGWLKDRFTGKSKRDPKADVQGDITESEDKPKSKGRHRIKFDNKLMWQKEENGFYGTPTYRHRLTGKYGNPIFRDTELFGMRADDLDAGRFKSPGRPKIVESIARVAEEDAKSTKKDWDSYMNTTGAIAQATSQTAKSVTSKDSVVVTEGPEDLFSNKDPLANMVASSTVEEIW